MANKDDLVKTLEDKVTDYKRFSFILLALSVFMFIGLIIPNEGVGSIQQITLIILSGNSIAFAMIFHRKAMKVRELLNEKQ
ncbi:YrhC family protein [Bacillaceae bacterium IKA-2]|nr:YrhC family protein [Bacillaceae bacterium IKA-2]